MDEDEMWDRYWRRGKRDRDRDRLAAHYLRWVDETTWRFPVARRESAFGKDDLYSAGYLGLIQSIERWRPIAGDFRPYALRRIWGAMQDELRSWDWVPRSARVAAREGREVPPQAQTPLSLDVHLDEETDVGLVDLLLAPDDLVPMDLEPAFHALATLRDENPRLYDVVTMLAEGRQGPYIAERLGVTESRVSQLRSQARSKLVDYGWEAAAPA